MTHKLHPLSLLDGQQADYVPSENMRMEFQREVVNKYLSVPLWQIVKVY